MRKINNYFSCLLCVLVLLSGFLMTGCTDDHIDPESTEQDNGDNQDGDKPTEGDQDKPSEGEGGEGDNPENEGGESGEGDNPENEGGEDNEENITYVENDAWTIEFKPKAEIDGYEHSNVLCVTSTDDNYYFASIIPEDYYLETDFEELAQYLYDDLIMMVDIYREAYGPDYSIFDMCYNTSSAESYIVYSGEYRAIVLGISDEGTLSGLYAISEPFVTE